MAKFLTDLRVREVDEFGGLWELLAPLSFQSDVLQTEIVVPVGFVTDFASVPRLPFIYLTEGGKGNKAAVIHDWLYSSQKTSRERADAVLREALLATGHSAATGWLFYQAVRLGGASHWTAPNNDQPAIVEQAMERPLP